MKSKDWVGPQMARVRRKLRALGAPPAVVERFMDDARTMHAEAVSAGCCPARMMFDVVSVGPGEADLCILGFPHDGGVDDDQVEARS